MVRSGWNGVREEQDGRGDAWAVCESCGGPSSLPRSSQDACGEQRNRGGGLEDAGWGLERGARLTVESARTCDSGALATTPMITGCPPPTSQRRPVELVTPPRELVLVASRDLMEATASMGHPHRNGRPGNHACQYSRGRKMVRPPAPAGVSGVGRVLTIEPGPVLSGDGGRGSRWLRRRRAGPRWRARGRREGAGEGLGWSGSRVQNRRMPRAGNSPPQ